MGWLTGFTTLGWVLFMPDHFACLSWRVTIDNVLMGAGARKEGAAWSSLAVGVGGRDRGDDYCSAVGRPGGCPGWRCCCWNTCACDDWQQSLVMRCAAWQSAGGYRLWCAF